MKLTVNRQLAGGSYYVSFKVTDFSAEERQKMESFGVPMINMLYLNSLGARASSSTPLTAIGEHLKPGFRSEEEAKKYEEDVVGQIRAALQVLRELKDDFTSTDEVPI